MDTPLRCNKYYQEIAINLVDLFCHVVCWEAGRHAMMLYRKNSWAIFQWSYLIAGNGICPYSIRDPLSVVADSITISKVKWN